MILQAKSAEIGVIPLDLLVQRLHSWLVPVRIIAHNETLVELDNLTQVELLSRRLVKPARGLDDHERLVVGRAHGDTLQAIVYEIHDAADG